MYKKALSLRDSGHYADAAKLYRIIAKRQEGQETDDGESLSAWAEASARTCECLGRRLNHTTEADGDLFVRKIKDIVTVRKSADALSALLSCDVVIGNWGSEFGPPEGPEIVAKRLIPGLSKVTKSARLSHKMLIGIVESISSAITVFEAQKDKLGWLVHAIIHGESADFDVIVAQDLRGAKSVKEP